MKRPQRCHSAYVDQVRFDRMQEGLTAVWQLGNQIRATVERATERTGRRRDAKTAFLDRHSKPQGICLPQRSEEQGKAQDRAPGQDSNQFPDGPLLRDIKITISVIEGPSKGLAYQMRDRCITLGRTGGGADFQFDEPEASEIQCILATRQNGVCLYDAVSIHGTYVNDQRIAAAELTDMSTFRVGSSLLLVKVHWNQAADVC